MNRTKRTLLSAALLVALAAVAEPPSARFPGEGFELRVYQDAEQAIPPSIFSIPGDGRHPDPPPPARAARRNPPPRGARREPAGRPGPLNQATVLEKRAIRVYVFENR